jgi:hypothetical protein
MERDNIPLGLLWEEPVRVLLQPLVNWRQQALWSDRRDALTVEIGELIRLINRRSNLPRLLLALSSGNNKSNDKNKPTDRPG